MLTGKMAEQAIDLTLPTIHELAATGVIVRRDLHIVIGTREEGYLEVLAERSLGDPTQWGYPYDQIARSKAEISARTGLSTREVQLLRPELLEEGDTKYWGSIVGGALVVACSGVQSHFDEAISTIILATLRGLLDEAVLEQREDKSTNIYV
jgi:hypothetical protein